MVSGGNMANFVCFLAARARKDRLGRAAVGPCRRWVAGELGFTHRRRRTRGSRKRPTCSGTEQTRFVGSKRIGSSALNVDALRRQIVLDRENGEQPFLVVGNGRNGWLWSG